MGKVICGYADHPTRAYLVVEGTRHWITDHKIFQQCGVVSVEPATNMEADGAPVVVARDFAAYKYLKGSGIEIGALNCPSVLPRGATALYIDYISPEESQARYPGLAIAEKVIVDDGETLATFEPSSLDFIVANHFLEHTRSPLGVIRTHLSKLKAGGILFYALPDKRKSFDRDRPVTPFQHLVMDEEHGSDVSDRLHYLEYVRYVDKVIGAKDIEAHATILKDTDNRIHFHVWDADGIRDLFTSAADYLGNSFEIIDVMEAELEVITILRKV